MHNNYVGKRRRFIKFKACFSIPFLPGQANGREYRATMPGKICNLHQYKQFRRDAAHWIVTNRRVISMTL
jgi:hypothetical protein